MGCWNDPGTTVLRTGTCLINLFISNCDALKFAGWFFCDGHSVFQCHFSYLSIAPGPGRQPPCVQTCSSSGRYFLTLGR